MSVLDDLSADQRRCLAVLGAAWPLHNLPARRGSARGEQAIEWLPFSRAACVVDLIPGVGLATFDADHLTRLVRAAHEQRVRLDVSATRSGRLRVMLHARKAEGRMSERHPGVEVFP